MPNWQRNTPRRELPPNWAELCREARDLFGTACYVCGHANAGDTDHVRPRSLGGTDDVSNLRPICGKTCPCCKAEGKPSCHLSKSGREGGQAKAAKRRRPAEPHPGIIR